MAEKRSINWALTGEPHAIRLWSFKVSTCSLCFSINNIINKMSLVMSLLLFLLLQSRFFSKYILSLWSVTDLDELIPWHLQTLRMTKAVPCVASFAPLEYVQYHNAQKGVCVKVCITTLQFCYCQSNSTGLSSVDTIGDVHHQWT